VSEVCSRLSEVKFFSSFPAKVLDEIDRAATLRKFRKNTHIISTGEESHACYVLVSGAAVVFTEDEEGEEFIHQSLYKGDCFGELGILDGKPRTANVMTTEPSECVVIPKDVLLRAMANDEAAAMNVIRSLVGRIRVMTDDVSSLALMDVYGRIARLLQSESLEEADGTRLMPRMTHQELAKRVGSSREMVSKIIKDLRVGGYVSAENHRIRLLKSLPSNW